ncbi:glycosyltransferase family 4 protein [Nodosilinea sp. E11]|uniref:glycosyltransferase family 4 protein n=1 Tax=Nodosilinea sp. E11 TaxID=3037479 RepID=UPI0029348133|nr:glycosyltransferase family 4 protein [Nodosilinea sp. E11]WOD39525.1 glycosyltransferase family 4 protein [Nodosilinea sp. E11]
MRIAQVTPLWEQVPPLAYGGTELVVSLLTEELVQRGHQVTLFASGDSQTLAQLDPGCDRALRKLGIPLGDYGPYQQRQLSKVLGRAEEFDIIHSHMDVAAWPSTQANWPPVVHTLHGPFTADCEKALSQYRQQNLISVSKSQQRADLELNYVATVYNAIAIDEFEFYPQPQDPPYLAFLGRMSSEKGPHLAIEIAKRSGWPLKMAGKVDAEDQAFFDSQVAPHIDGQQIEFLGEVSQAEKKTLIGQATATLFPITWPEPFGLVMTESMVSGTPVVAMAIGSAPEVVADGKTGFLCQSVDDCIEAVAQIHRLSRQACRDHVALNFSVAKMVDGYEAVYRQLLRDRTKPSFGPQRRVVDLRPARPTLARIDA